MQHDSRRRYIIFAPPRTRNNGVRVLYTLYSRLREAGYESFIFCPERQEAPYQYMLQFDRATRENDIVIYPEVISGNPLRFRHVVRYVLFYPGRLDGETTFFPAEKIFTWDCAYLDAPALRQPYVDRSLFYDAHLPKRQNCYFVHKGGKWRDIPDMENMVEINMQFPETREELAHLLQTTDILYSFDDHSALNLEAALCGAHVKIVRENDIVDYTKNILDDEKTLHRQFAEFIAATQTFRYDGNLEPYPLHRKQALRLLLARCGYPLVRLAAGLLPVASLQKLSLKFKWFLQRAGGLGVVRKA